MDLRLLYTDYPAVNEDFSYSSWCSKLDECRSTRYFVFTIGEAAISWKSKKQTLIAQSSMEFEFFSITVVRDEIEWLSYFLWDLSLKELQGAITIYYDNQVSSTVAVNSLLNENKWTILLKHGYLNELICHHVISTISVWSSKNLVDHLNNGMKKNSQKDFRWNGSQFIVSVMYIYYLYQVISSKLMLLIIRYLVQKLSNTCMHISYHLKGSILSINEYKAFLNAGCWVGNIPREQTYVVVENWPPPMGTYKKDLRPS